VSITNPAFGGPIYLRVSRIFEKVTSLIRKWYIQGQADYRAGNKMPKEIEGNHSLTEAWLMGWQSDAYADTHNLPFSKLGDIYFEPTSLIGGDTHQENND